MNVNLVTESTVADIGCDHAFVSIYLIQNKVAGHVYAMDVRSGPLDIARTNVKRYGLENSITVRLSDGFKELACGEAECAIIAGMGGPLMVRILSEAKAHIDEGIHLVLQPQSEPELVREYLYSINYEIIEEAATIDDGKYYFAMKAVPASGAIAPYNKEELLYGRRLLDKNDLVLFNYLQDSLHKNESLYNRLIHIDTDKASDRIGDIEQDIIYIKKALSYYRQ